MRIAIMLEGQEGLSYDTILGVAERAEERGLHGVYRSDHYGSTADRDDRGSTDAWATLAGLARDTERIHLGTLVSPATFRAPAVLAKMAATVSEMAGPDPDGASRITLGMGTGWHETEHRRHGFPFEDLDTRFRRLEEQLDVVTRLWEAGAQPFDTDGEFARLRDARFSPVPDPRPRLAVGGKGLQRTPGLAARFADELNGLLSTPEQCREQRAALDRACEEHGRDPSTVRYSLMTGCLVGATDEEFRARVRRQQEWAGDNRSPDEVIAARDGIAVQGTPEQARDHLGRLAEAGVETVMLQDLLPDDLEMIDLVADELAGTSR